MKQAISFILSFLFILSTNSLLAQNLVLKPTNFTPGDKVVIKYNPIGTAVEKVEKIEAICYEITEDGLIGTEIYLQQKEQAYSGAFIVSKDAKVVFIAFSGDDKNDNNNDEGYGFIVYERDRKIPLPDAFYQMSKVYSSYYRNLGISRDYKKALAYLQKEYSLNPEAKKEGKYAVDYSLYGAKAKDEAVIEECKSLAKALKLQVKNEQDIQDLSSILSNIGEKEAANEMNAKILKEYPEGKLAQRNMLTSLYRAQSLEDKIEIHNSLMNKYADTEIIKESMDQITGIMAVAYGEAYDWENCDKYFSIIDNPVLKANYLNILAWTLSGENIEAKPEHAVEGQNYSKQSLELIQKELESGISKPESRTKNQWKKQQEYSFGMYADSYALCAYHAGSFKEALDYQTIACKTNEFQDGEMTERYCVFLEKVEGTEATEKALQKLISKGLATAKMKEHYQELYLSNNTLESALQKNMDFLQSLADEKKKKELKAKMLNDKAPDFALVNLKGEKVSLSDLKGKVVVLDFWATWCGPCKASFPGMQNAVNKYENDDVVFLFLDTWERVQNKEENAQKFIDEKGYTFNVLLDNDNEIVSKYKVSGIPTKFIVDKKGNIRFKSVGFSGNNDELVNELSMMIDMANDVSSEAKTMP